MYVPWHSTVANLNKVYGYLWASWTKGLQKRNFKECEDRTKARFSSWDLKMTRKILRWKIQPLLNQAYRRAHQNILYCLKAGFATLCRNVSFPRSSQVNRTCSSKGTRNDKWRWWSVGLGRLILMSKCSMREKAAMLSFQTGICSNIGHGLIVWWSRYLGRGGDQETTKSTCFLALKIRKIIAISW